MRKTIGMSEGGHIDWLKRALSDGKATPDKLFVLEDFFELDPGTLSYDPVDGSEARRPDEPRLTIPITTTDLSYHYSARSLPVVGREKEMRTLDDFLSCDSGFAWLQIAGFGGQGKSRLSLELARKSCESDWHAGFISMEELKRFSESCSHWQPIKRTLIILDYVVGYEALIGSVLSRLSERTDFKLPVRWLLVERQRWDRSHLEFDPSHGEPDRIQRSLANLNTGLADWFQRLTTNDTLGYTQRSCFTPSVVELKALDSADLRGIVHEWTEKIGGKVELSDDELEDALARIDPTGRPLYAYFAADAISCGYAVSGWTREDLLKSVLSREYQKRWKMRFGDVAPTLSDDTPALRLSMLATIVGALDIARLSSVSDWSVPNQRDFNQALTIVDGPAGVDIFGHGTAIPKLEPDILGGWFILELMRTAAMPVESIVRTAWRIEPQETAATFLRIAQDFPLHAQTVHLLAIQPGSNDGASALGRISLDLLVAIRDRGRIKQIGLLPRIEEAARNGDANAMARLGFCYKEGIGLDEADLPKAIYWYEQGVKHGDGTAMAYLGHCYFTGIGVDAVDYEKAAELFAQGADAGNGQAMTYLGMCHQLGIAFDASSEKAVEWYQRGAKAGDALAMVYLGMAYASGHGVEKNIELAFDNYLQGAELGSAHAKAYVGHCFERGNGVAKNVVRAVGWYESGTQAGSGVAMAHLGRCYREGIGVERDENQAVVLLERGIDAGSGLAMYELGVCYYDGVGVEKDQCAAVKLWRDAARLQEPIAIERLKALDLKQH